MILITRIEATEIQDMRVANIRHVDPEVLRTRLDEPCEIADDYKIQDELVYGQWFVRRNGTRICIGTSKQAQDIIGVQYESWENQSKELKDARALIRSLKDKLEEYNKASPWKLACLAIKKLAGK